MAAKSANPTEETTVVNIKSMPVRAWNRAKDASVKQGETLGEWLSRAINQLADREAGQRETVPNRDSRPVNLAAPPEMPPADVEALARAVRIATEAAGIAFPKRTARHVAALADQHMRAARGLPEPAPRVHRKMLEGHADLANPAIPAAKPSLESANPTPSRVVDVA